MTNDRSAFISNTARARQVVAVLVKHGFGRILDKLNLEHVPGLGRIIVRLRPHPGPVPLLDRLKLAFEELGPTFIKLGQLMSSRPDLVTAEVADALSGLRDTVTPFPGQEALRIIDAALPGGIKGSFASLSEEPQAAASIAQVHFGVLLDGTPVAVKVCRPRIKEIVETDISILFLLARLAQRYVPEIAVYDPVRIVAEFARNIRREMDLNMEAGNIERFSAFFASDQRLRIPRLIRSATSAQVLTIERLVSGLPIDDPAALRSAGYDPVCLAHDFLDIFFAQVLVHGLFHGDPHPGNCMILDGGRIGLLDFGVLGTIDRETRRSLAAIFRALVDFDVNRLVKEYISLGIITEEADLDEFRRDLVDFMRPYYGLPLHQLPLGEILGQAMAISLRHRLRLPADVILLAKAVMVVESIVLKLNPDINLLETAKPFAAKLAVEELKPRAIVERLGKVLADYAELASDFPRRMSMILGKVLRGKLRIDFHHDNLENLIREMDRSANRLSFSLVIAATIIGSSLIMTIDRGLMVFGYPLLGIVGFSVAGLLGLWLIIAILRSGRL